MYPGMIAWLRSARRGAGCGAFAGWGPGDDGHGVSAGCGPGGGRGRGGGRGHGHGHGHGYEEGASFGGGDHDGDFSGGGFGVRRPLRFLAWKLELSDSQVAELARILNDLKTERAQAAVDNRRTTAAFADLVGGESLDETKLGEAAAERVKSAERLRDAVVKALAKIHAILDAEQRSRLAYLIRTGALLI
jgi:Spy/CpxP family protein refolding chaperone